MKCKFCREELPEGSKVCPVCGTPVEPENEERPEKDEGQNGDSGLNSQNPYGQNPYGQNPYQYGSPNQEPQGQYQYGSPEQGQNPYQYGSPNQGQNPYQYGSSNQGQNPYQYGSPNQGQNPYQYGSPNQGQYQNNNKGVPHSGTPYMILAIFTVLLCCIPLGIVAIVYASRINSLLRAGDYAGARDSAKKARLFSIIGIIGGAVSLSFLIIFNLSSLRNELSSVPSIISEQEDTGITEDIAESEPDEEKKPVVTAPAVQSSELGETWDTYTVQINDKVLKFPCAFEELEAAGLTLDTEDTPENYVVNANEYVMVYFEDENDNYIMVDLVNPTDNAKTVKECLIGGVYVTDYGISEGGVTVLFPGGLRIGSTREEMLAKYGNTDDIYEGDTICIYTWYAEDTYYSKCEMDIDSDTGLINSMNIQNYGE